MKSVKHDYLNVEAIIIIILVSLKDEFLHKVNEI